MSCTVTIFVSVLEAIAVFSLSSFTASGTQVMSSFAPTFSSTSFRTVSFGTDCVYSGVVQVI